MSEVLSVYLGYIGVLFLIYSYYFVSNSLLKPNSNKNQVLNLIGNALLIFCAYSKSNYPSIAINLIFSFIAVSVIYKNFKLIK